MVKLKHIRFNQTLKNKQKKEFIRFFLSYKSKQKKKTNKKYIFPLSRFTRRYVNNRKINIHNRIIENNNYTTNTTRKTKIAMPRFVPRFTIKRRFTQPNLETISNNSNNSNNIVTYNHDNVKKQLLLKKYMKNKTLKHKRMQNLNQPNTYNKNKTPIYNSYVPGSGIGASNIATRRLKKKFAYLN